MNGRRAIVCLCALCAVLVSAAVAQTATAAGTTGYTCVSTEATGFSNDHCTASSEEGPYSHVAVANNTTTEITAAAAGITKFKFTLGGIFTELQASSMFVSGWMENREDGGEMHAFGEGTATFLNATVTQPAGKGCKVSTDNGGVAGEEGVVHTNAIAATTKGQGDAVKFEPAEGEVFVSFIISGCKGSAALETLNKTYTVTGSVKGTPEGATIRFTHANTTEQNTLKLNGSIKAGIDTAVEIEAKNPEEIECVPPDTFHPLSATT